MNLPGLPFRLAETNMRQFTLSGIHPGELGVRKTPGLENIVPGQVHCLLRLPCRWVWSMLNTSHWSSTPGTAMQRSQMSWAYSLGVCCVPIIWFSNWTTCVSYYLSWYGAHPLLDRRWFPEHIPRARSQATPNSMLCCFKLLHHSHEGLRQQWRKHAINNINASARLLTLNIFLLFRQ